MKKSLLTAIALVALLSNVGAAILAHTAADEIFLRESQPNSNQGNTRILIGGQGTDAQFVALMKFSLTDVYAELGASEGTITSVQFDLGPSMSGAGAGFATDVTIDLYSYMDFDAATATWNQPDGLVGNDPTPGGTFSSATLLAQQVFTTADIEPSTHVFGSTPGLVNYLQAAYDNGDAEVFFRLSNDSLNGPNAFLRTETGTEQGIGQASLIVVPEPSTLSLLALLGAPALLFRRRLAS